MSHEPTTVLVLLSVYNGAAFLREQLDSIFAQQQALTRIVVRDDGSTDGSRDILGEFSRRYPDRFSLMAHNGERLGALASFGRLMEHAATDAAAAKAPYIAFSDQDDVWLPHKIATLAHRMAELEARRPAAPRLVHSDLKVVDAELRTLGESFWAYQGIDPSRDGLNRLLLQNTVTGCASLINWELARLALPVPRSCLMHDAWLALVASAFGEIAYVAEPLVLYRQHGANDVGARRYDWKYVAKNWRRILSRKEFQRKLGRHIEQARALAERYGSRLPPAQREVLSAFLGMRERGFFARRRTLIRHGIAVSGATRNLGILLRL